LNTSMIDGKMVAGGKKEEKLGGPGAGSKQKRKGSRQRVQQPHEDSIEGEKPIGGRGGR